MRIQTHPEVPTRKICRRYPMSAPAQARFSGKQRSAKPLSAALLLIMLLANLLPVLQAPSPSPQHAAGTGRYAEYRGRSLGVVARGLMRHLSHPSGGWAREWQSDRTKEVGARVYWMRLRGGCEIGGWEAESSMDESSILHGCTVHTVISTLPSCHVVMSADDVKADAGVHRYTHKNAPLYHTHTHAKTGGLDDFTLSPECTPSSECKIKHAVVGMQNQAPSSSPRVGEVEERRASRLSMMIDDVMCGQTDRRDDRHADIYAHTHRVHIDAASPQTTQRPPAAAQQAGTTRTTMPAVTARANPTDAAAAANAVAAIRKGHPPTHTHAHTHTAAATAWGTAAPPTPSTHAHTLDTRLPHPTAAAAVQISAAAESAGLLGVAGCCRVVQSGAEWCGVVRCGAECCNVVQYGAVCCIVVQYDVMLCSVVQCVAVCCSVLQCVAACCSVL